MPPSMTVPRSQHSHKFPRRAVSIFRNLRPSHFFPLAPPLFPSLALESGRKEISRRHTPNATTGASLQGGEPISHPSTFSLSRSSSLMCAPCCRQIVWGFGRLSAYVSMHNQTDRNYSDVLGIASTLGSLARGGGKGGGGVY